MREYGSDFHYIDLISSDDQTINKYYPNSVLYALGRHPLLDIINRQGYKRIWMPEYYCFDVVDAITRFTDCKVLFYEDSPLIDDENNTLASLHFEKNDVLLRINYFGLRGFRSNISIPISVIEDHSHDLIGEWAANSDAMWCFASLRKTVSVAQGGILWSPQNAKLFSVFSNIENELDSALRSYAMSLKSLYLAGLVREKNTFRNIFVASESKTELLDVCSLDNLSKEYIQTFNIGLFYQKKRDNFNYLFKVCQDNKINCLKPENKDGQTPFSLILMFKNKQERDSVRINLIENNIFPAILWPIPENFAKSKEISDKMLSVHCDARYTDCIEDMAKILLNSIKNARNY